MTHTGNYNVGMQGPGQAIVWTITAPDGVDYTTKLSIALAVTFTFSDGQTLTVDNWSISNITPTSFRATHIPTVNEFTVPGWMFVRSSMTLDGVVYPLITQRDEVREEPL